MSNKKNKKWRKGFAKFARSEEFENRIKNEKCPLEIGKKVSRNWLEVCYMFKSIMILLEFCHEKIKSDVVKKAIGNCERTKDIGKALVKFRLIFPHCSDKQKEYICQPWIAASLKYLRSMKGAKFEDVQSKYEHLRQNCPPEFKVLLENKGVSLLDE